MKTESKVNDWMVQAFEDLDEVESDTPEIDPEICRIIKSRLTMWGYSGAVEEGVEVIFASKFGIPDPTTLIIRISHIYMIVSVEKAKTVLGIVKEACRIFVETAERSSDETLFNKDEVEFYKAFEGRLLEVEVELPKGVEIHNFKSWLEVEITGIGGMTVGQDYSLTLNSESATPKLAGEMAAEFLIGYFKT